MRESFRIWSQSPPDPLFRLSLESFLVHARNLLNAFYEARTLDQVSDDDVLARDFYIPPATWDALRPSPAPPTLRSVQGRLNKLIAHLSYSRVKYALEDPLTWSWPCNTMAGELDELTMLFLKNLPAEHRGYFAMLE